MGLADGPDSPAALTDSEGRFTLEHVPSDQREMSAAKSGYVRTAVPAADGEIHLSRGGVITGRVLDDLGVPIPFVNVAVFRVRRGGASVGFDRFRATETDDLGEYRLFGLPAGEFVVAAAPGRFGAATATIPMPLENLVFHTYYPHAETPEAAQMIPVRAGEETPGVDLTMAMPPVGPPQTANGPKPQSPLFAQRTDGDGGSSIHGRVISDNGLPVRRARVQLISADGAFSPYFVTTDDEGAYGFDGLKAGGYLVTAGSLGGRPAPFSRTRGSGRPDRILLGPRSVLEGMDIVLPAGGVVSGRILDEYGDPMANANVRLELVMMGRGRRRVVPVPSIAARNTDDRGRYRIFDLPPGKYVVAAVVGEPVPGWTVADWPGYALTYFPGTPIPSEAETVELTAGQQSLNVDFALVHGRLARVTGVATMANGSPLQGVVALTQSARSGAIGTPAVHVQTEADGSFAFARIPPGEYVVQASTKRASISSEGEFASQFLTVNGVDVTGLSMHLSAGSTIEGKVTFEGGEPPEDPELHISPLAVDPDLDSLVDNAPARADIHEDGSFEIDGVNGPRRLAVTHAPPGWALKVIRVGGVDATDLVVPFGTAEQSLHGVEVVMTTRLTELAVRPDNPLLGGSYRVLAFATDTSRRFPGSRFMATGEPAEPNGVALLRGLPPGEYYVAALSLNRPGGLPDDPLAMMEALVTDATKVTLTEGEHRSVSVTILGR